MKNFLLTLCFLLIAAGLGLAQSVAPPLPSATVSWTEATPNVTTFNIYRGTSCPGGENYSKPFSSVTGSVFNFVDGSVMYGGTYCYTVTAVLGIESAPSNEVTAVIVVPPVASIVVK